MSLCSVGGCERAVTTRKKQQLCEMHFYRWRRHGDVHYRLRNANGEGGFSKDGYARLPASPVGKRVREHIAVAERALGKRLPPGAVVHHWNEDRADNRLENLAIFPDQGYHNLIHGRMKAMAATGDPNKKPCRFCGRYDDEANLKKNGTSHYHNGCNTEYQRQYRAVRRADMKGA